MSQPALDYSDPTGRRTCFPLSGFILVSGIGALARGRLPQSEDSSPGVETVRVQTVPTDPPRAWLLPGCGAIWVRPC